MRSLVAAFVCLRFVILDFGVGVAGVVLWELEDCEMGRFLVNSGDQWREMGM